MQHTIEVKLVLTIDDLECQPGERPEDVAETLLLNSGAVDGIDDITDIRTLVSM